LELRYEVYKPLVDKLTDGGRSRVVLIPPRPGGPVKIEVHVRDAMSDETREYVITIEEK
jgi:hypothetical protein